MSCLLYFTVIHTYNECICSSNEIVLDRNSKWKLDVLGALYKFNNTGLPNQLDQKYILHVLLKVFFMIYFVLPPNG